MSEYLNEDICQFSNDASASSFGWNFQANAGIFLFLKYMPDAADIKIESISQDIEITLIDERKVFAQAKSAQDSTTIKDQKEKFKDAIISSPLIFINIYNIISVIFTNVCSYKIKKINAYIF